MKGKEEDIGISMMALEAAASEMIRGRDSAARLAVLLTEASTSPPPPPTDAGVVAVSCNVLSCFNRALAALGSQKEKAGAVAKKRKYRSAATSNQSDEHAPKKTVVVRATAADEYTWRKYGQKDILYNKFPRCYFRCTYKFDQNCQATKQVQRSEKDPSMFVITYMGKHTCTDAAAADTCDADNAQSFIISFGSSSATARNNLFSLTSSPVSSDTCGMGGVVSGVSVGNCSLTSELQTPPCSAVASAAPEFMSSLEYVRSSGVSSLDWEFEKSFDMDCWTGYDDPFDLSQY